MVEEGVMIPDSRAATAVQGLKVEPGAYAPPMARFSRGVPTVSLTSLE